MCAGPGEVSNLGCERRHCSLYHLVYPSLSPTGSISTLASSLRQITATLHLNLPLGVTNEGREAITKPEIPTFDEKE